MSEAVLKKLYSSVEDGLVGANKLYLKAKRIDPSITKKQTIQFVKAQETSQQFTAQNVTNRALFPIHAKTQYPFSRTQIDLMDFSLEFSSKRPNPFRYLFLFIDIRTRYAIGVPMITKSQTDCLAALKKVVQEVKEVSPEFPIQQIDSDSESAFKSAIFANYCKQQRIVQSFSPIGDINSLAFINRLCRTLRSMLEQFKATHNKFDWSAAMKIIIKNYNNQIHTALNATPTESLQPNSLQNRAYDLKIRKQIFKARQTAVGKLTIRVGDKVRLRIKRGLFEKRTQASFTKSIHTVESEEIGGLWTVSGRTTPYKTTDLLKVDRVDENQPADLTNYEPAIRQNITARRTTRRVRKEGISEADVLPQQAKRTRKQVKPQYIFLNGKYHRLEDFGD